MVATLLGRGPLPPLPLMIAGTIVTIATMLVVWNQWRRREDKGEPFVRPAGRQRSLRSSCTQRRSSRSSRTLPQRL